MEEGKGIGKLALVLFPLCAWLGAGFLVFPKRMEKLALEIDEQINLPPLERVCFLLGSLIFTISLAFLFIWLRSRAGEF